MLQMQKLSLRLPRAHSSWYPSLCPHRMEGHSKSPWPL